VANDWEKTGARNLNIVRARLAAGSQLESATAEITTVAHRLESQYRRPTRDGGAPVETYTDYFHGLAT